jgi:cellulose synthase/poly-beta-1,6-N-acetylglucosamine synthase-like glycosyltransferase
MHLDFSFFLTSGVEFLSLYAGVFYLLTFFENRDKLDEDKKITNYPSVTVIIPAYNEEKNIAAAIESAAGLDYPKEKLFIAVVNDGSKDRTLQVAREASQGKENIRIIDLQPNGGKAAAVNFVLREVKTDLVATLDADSWVTAGALKKMLPYFEEDERVAAVTAAMKINQPKTFWQKIQRVEYLALIYLKKMLSFLDGITATPGPFSIYRTKVFSHIGYFDEQNITEDGEIALRLQKYNYIILNAHEAEVFTNSPATLKNLMKQRVRWNRGTIRNFIKYRRLIGNSHYGDFGLFVLPITIILLFFSSIFLFYNLVRLLIIAGNRIYYASSYGYRLIDIPGIGPGQGFDSFYFHPSFTQLIVFAILGFFATSLYFIHRYHRQDFGKTLLFYLPYLAVYYTVFSLGFLAATLAYEITNRKLSWHK